MVSEPIEKKAVLQGAALALAVTLPPVVLVRILHGDDMEGQESNLWIVVVLALLAGFALGGYRAARDKPRNGLSHAVAAGAAAFVAIALYSLVRRAIGGDLAVSDVARLFVVGSISVSVAMLGGMFAIRRARPR